MVRTFDCHAVADLAADFVDGALPPDGRKGVQAHLRACEPCRGGVEACLRMHRMLRSVGGERMPHRMKQELLQAFRKHITTRSAPARPIGD